MISQSAKYDYTTSPLRAVIAFLVLSFTLSSPIQFFYLKDMLRAWSFSEGGTFPSEKFSLWFLPAFWAVAAVIALLFFVSVWALMHIRGNRSPRDAFVTGYLVAAMGVIILLLTNAVSVVQSVSGFLWLVLIVGMTSGAAGLFCLLAWRFAYRRVSNLTP